MKRVDFKARGQSLERIRKDGEGPIVRGTRGYLQAHFDLDAPWQGRRVVARFFDERGHEHAAAVERRRCMVPDGVTGGKKWSVSLVGAGKDGSRLTTNRVTVYQGAV